MRALTWIACVLFSCIPLSPAVAHEVRPAYLDIRETEPETYDVLWKVPARGEALRFGLYVEFSPDTVNIGETRSMPANNSFVERSRVKRTGGLAGSRVTIAGLGSTMTDVLVRMEFLDGTSQVIRLTPLEPSFVVEAAPGKWSVAGTYLHLGVEHILGGIDHLLFVLGLLLIVGREWVRLIKTITAFTIAHSITLALAALGLVNIPQAPVEAVIALSIMFVAVEILHGKAGRPGLTARAPWVVAFTFGLLHGFGFAGALAETGLPQNSIPLALLLFNVGVELGQLIFVAFAVACIAGLKRMRKTWPEWTEAITPYAIGSLAAFWTIERTLSFLFA